MEIPEAHHYAMLDQPLAFVAALRALLESWLRAAGDPEIASTSEVRFNLQAASPD